jgi:hypothetical protein
MRRYGVFKVDDVAYSKTHEQAVDESAAGVDADEAGAGFNTPSRKRLLRRRPSGAGGARDSAVRRAT